jgi:hypothetical protein
MNQDYGIPERLHITLFEITFYRSEHQGRKWGRSPSYISDSSGSDPTSPYIGTRSKKQGGVLGTRVWMLLRVIHSRGRHGILRVKEARRVDHFGERRVEGMDSLDFDFCIDISVHLAYPAYTALSPICMTSPPPAIMLIRYITPVFGVRHHAVSLYIQCRPRPT